ncbi:hypothetical protein AB6A40_011374 [Gnathostoma spinigerum]|uniref:Uncharacterized protein n=1 Tax=Gnathostoma spinigerum TaxID=75299 RepID=A0ABD6EXI6_9BILA
MSHSCTLDVGNLTKTDTENAAGDDGILDKGNHVSGEIIQNGMPSSESERISHLSTPQNVTSHPRRTTQPRVFNVT